MPGGGEEKVVTLLKGFLRDGRMWGERESLLTVDGWWEREVGEEEIALQTVDWREMGGGGWMASSRGENMIYKKILWPRFAVSLITFLLAVSLLPVTH